MNQNSAAAIDRPAFPEIVVLCGSTRFKDAFYETARSESLAGRIVLTVSDLDPRPEARHVNVPIDAETKQQMDELHKRKIDLADTVLVLNVGGYIGESTRSEIDYAHAHGKPVRYLEHVRCPVAVCEYNCREFCRYYAEQGASGPSGVSRMTGRRVNLATSRCAGCRRRGHMIAGCFPTVQGAQMPEADRERFRHYADVLRAVAGELPGAAAAVVGRWAAEWDEAASVQEEPETAPVRDLVRAGHWSAAAPSVGTGTPAEEVSPASVTQDRRAGALTEYVLLTERCTSRSCGSRVVYSELTDNDNTHWHVKPGVSLVRVEGVSGGSDEPGRQHEAGWMGPPEDFQPGGNQQLSAEITRLEQDRDDACAMLQHAEDRHRAVVVAARHPHKGPNNTDATMLVEAAVRAEGGYPVGGQHTRAMIGRVLRAVAAALGDGE